MDSNPFQDQLQQYAPIPGTVSPHYSRSVNSHVSPQSQMQDRSPGAQPPQQQLTTEQQRGQPPQREYVVSQVIQPSPPPPPPPPPPPNRKGQKRKRSPNWSDGEVNLLLEIWRDDSVQSGLLGDGRKKPVWQLR